MSFKNKSNDVFMVQHEEISRWLVTRVSDNNTPEISVSMRILRPHQCWRCLFFLWYFLLKALWWQKKVRVTENIFSLSWKFSLKTYYYTNMITDSCPRLKHWSQYFLLWSPKFKGFKSLYYKSHVKITSSLL